MTPVFIHISPFVETQFDHVFEASLCSCSKGGMLGWANMA